MSKGQTLRDLVNKRLTAAAEDIFALVERTIAEYEEELCRSKEENQRKQKLLDYVLSPQVLVQRAEVQTHVINHPKPSLNQELTEIPQIKAEPVEQMVKSEEEELPEEVTLWKKNEEQSYFLQQIQTEHKEKTKAEDKRVEDIILDSYGHNLQPESEEQTDNDDDWDPPTLREDRSQVQRRYISTDAQNSGQFANSQAPETIVTVTNRNILGNEVRGGKGRFECPVCPKKCGTESALLKHTRLHTGENPNTCSVCKKTFKQSHHLKTHMRTHTGERPYSCSICHKTFVQKCTLDVHWRTHTGERPFGCFFCQKGFIDSSSRRRHMRIHTGERPYTCSLCGRGFNLSTTLKNHLRSQHFIENEQL